MVLYMWFKSTMWFLRRQTASPFFMSRQIYSIILIYLSSNYWTLCIIWNSRQTWPTWRLSLQSILGPPPLVSSLETVSTYLNCLLNEVLNSPERSWNSQPKPPSSLSFVPSLSGPNIDRSHTSNRVRWLKWKRQDILTSYWPKVGMNAIGIGWSIL